MTTAAADYGTQFYTLAFVDGSGCQWSLPNQYNGDGWTASQRNYDEVPGGPSGAWNNDGAC
jgi:hypothetical protein